MNGIALARLLETNARFPVRVIVNSVELITAMFRPRSDGMTAASCFAICEVWG